jgi:glycosyltransferase involved in cell wall biosynthesis
MNELISIIIPIYKVEQYLEKCVDSIINQTYNKLEIILVNDGSPDRCPAICDNYAAKDSRVKVIHKKNGGADSARKVGITASTGKYIGYVDGDDWIEPDMYEKLYTLAKRNNASIVESGVIDSYPNTESSRVSYFEEGFYSGEDFVNTIAPKYIYTGEFFQHGIFPYFVTKLFIRKSVMAFQLMDEPSDNIVDDAMTVFPCIAAAKSIYITHQCFYHYRVRSNSTKRTSREDVASLIHICYPEWKKRFIEVDFWNLLEKQIQYFAMYLLVSKAPNVFDDPNSNLRFIPYGGIKKKSKIVLYGAGMVGIQLWNYIQKIQEYQLVYWADRNYEQFDDDLPIKDPDKITTRTYDYVIVAILNAKAAKSAIHGLIILGIPEDKIRWIDTQYLNNPQMLLKKAIYNSVPII